MEHDFWHKKWEEGRIGFHQQEVNPFLAEYWSALALNGNEQVFVPLCGKSNDMLWLREQGHPVLGVELNESACASFFSEWGSVPDIQSGGMLRGAFTEFSLDGIALLCGDFFALKQSQLASVQAVYDRAALIALPEAMRKRYAEFLQQTLPVGVQILLITLDFPGDDGPPFSVTESEIRRLFEARFAIQALAHTDERGRCERAWLLQDQNVST